MTYLLKGLLVACLLGLTHPAAAQTAAPEADPGVRPVRLIDRAEIRVSRVEVAPGAVRKVHTHDDVEYHVWLPLEGSLELTKGSDQPVAVTVGQAFFFARGTPHGFRNLGTTPAAVMEIFVKQTKASARLDPADALATAMAALADTH